MTDQGGLPPQNLALEIALLFCLAVLWGSSYVLIKIALETIPPVSLITMRVVIAAVVLFAVVAVRGDRLPRDGQTWRYLFVQSLLIATGAWIVLAWGQQFVESGLAGVLNSTAPIFVLLLTVFITRHEVITPGRALGALLGIAGVALIVGVDALQGLGQQVIAQLAILLGAAFYGCGAIYGKRFGHLAPPVSATGTMLCACLTLVPLSLAFDQPWTIRPSWESLAAAIVLGVASTAGGLMLYFRLVRTLGSLGVASQGYLRSGVSVVLGMIFLGEAFRPVIAVGLAAVILGVASINLSGRINWRRTWV